MTLPSIMATTMLNNRINGLVRRGKSFDTDVHVLAVQALLHAQQHGDTTFISKLVFGMPKSSRGKAFNKWVFDHAPLRIAKTKKGEVVKLNKQRTDADWKLEAANNVPFYDYTIEREPTVLKPERVAGQLQALINRVQKASAEQQSETDAALMQVLVPMLETVATQVSDTVTQARTVH